MPWKERFDLNRGFINYEAMSDAQLHELLNDQGFCIDDSRENLILKLVELRDIDSEKAEEVWRKNPDNYMDGRYNE